MADFPNKADGPPSLPTGKNRPKPTPVISGASKATPSVMSRLRKSIFSESPRNLGAQIGKDIIVPRLKLGVQETLNSFIAGVLWGNIGQQPLGRNMHNTTRSQTGYSQQSTQQALQQAQGQVVHRASGNYEEIFCPTEEKATTLLAAAFDYIATYSMMSIGDLYELAELPAMQADASYGWHGNIDGARIYHTVEGYELKMPRTTPL